MKKRSLLQVKEHRQETFVGRAYEIASFEENLQLSWDNPHRKYIFNVFGQGGVGKTTQLHYFRHVAERIGVLTVFTDETDRDLLAVLARWAKQLREQGHPLGQFETALNDLKKRRQELEAGPIFGVAENEINLLIGENRPLASNQILEHFSPQHLHQILARYFNIEEIKTLCFRLEISHEDIFGAGLTAKARELVTFCDRHGRIYDLIREIKKLRPHLSLVSDLPFGEGQLGLAGLRAQDMESRLFSRQEANNLEDISFLLKPIDELTTLFFKELWRITKVKNIVLFCDTYEKTGEFLDPWWLSILAGKYGENIPANLVIVIAGRKELNIDTWSIHEALIAFLPLKPFNETETKSYLIQHGIENEEIVRSIFELSGGLPLLIATLAIGQPEKLEDIIEPSGPAVTRFLRWVEDPQKRRVALDAALPRRFNQEVVAVLVEDDPESIFNWLQTMPFVYQRADGWMYYHDLVRAQMLRFKIRESRKNWGDIQNNLSRYYQALYDNLNLDVRTKYRDQYWQEFQTEASYHHICQLANRSIGASLQIFLNEYPVIKNNGYAKLWAEAIEGAGKDINHPELENWGASLLECFTALENNNYIKLVDKLK